MGLYEGTFFSKCMNRCLSGENYYYVLDMLMYIISSNNILECFCVECIGSVTFKGDSTMLLLNAVSRY